MKRLEIFLLLLFGGSAHALPSGAPSTACSSLIPSHGGSPQSSSSPYTIDMSIFNLYSDGNYYYQPGQEYQCKQLVNNGHSMTYIDPRLIDTLYSTVTLSGGGSMFRGFLLQARLMADDTTLIGSFSNPASGSKLSSCSPPEVRTPQHTGALNVCTVILTILMGLCTIAQG